MRIKQCIALYIRLSDDDDNIDGKSKVESNSVTSQRKLLEGFIAQQQEFAGMATLEYVDDGYSGTNFNRPSFQRMMEDARAGRIGIIVIKDFSRFGRDYLEVGSYLEKILPLMGVRVLSVNDGFDSENCSGMTGGMSIALKNMLNAMYSKDLSGKVKTAMVTHARNGECMQSQPKYGYLKDPKDKHHLIIDPEAADVVRTVFTMAADGKTKGQIAKYLNENQVMTCMEHMRLKGVRITPVINKEKKLWSVSTISYMLKNEIYLGKTVWNKRKIDVTGNTKYVINNREDWIVVEGTHEAIVSEELFAKANEKAFTHKTISCRSEKTIPTFLMCPSCGRRMTLHSSGKFYRCEYAYSSGLPECYNSRMDKAELEETVLTCARNMVQFISENLEKKKKEWLQTSLQEEKISTMQSEKKRLSSRKMRLYADYRTGSLTKEKYMDELAHTAERIAEIDRRIMEIENKIEESRRKMEKVGEKQAELNDVAALKNFDKEILGKIIDKAYVYGGGRIEIFWKMDDIFFTGEKSEIVEVDRKN